MAQKRNSKWRPPPSWIYFRLHFLTYSRFFTVDLNHHPKFRANISICGWLTVIFQNSRWRPSAILDFRKPDFCPMVGLGLLIFHHDAKFGEKCWSAPKLGPKTEIQDGGHRHLEFTSGCNFWHIADFPLLISTTTQNFVPISQSVADLQQFFKIQDGGRPPSWIFENLISVQWLALGYWFSITMPNLVQKCWSAPKLGPKTKFKMAAAAILNLLPVAIFDI